MSRYAPATLALWTSLALAVLALTGCAGPGFRVRGELSSKGGALGTWRWSPQGCIRTRQSGAGTGLATLLWIDPVRRDTSRAPGQPNAAENAPVRLDLERVGKEPVAVLETVHTVGTEFNARNCRTLTLETHEDGATLRKAPGSFGGTLHMDCEVHGQHVTAAIEFEGCDY